VACSCPNFVPRTVSPGAAGVRCRQPPGGLVAASSGEVAAGSSVAAAATDTARVIAATTGAGRPAKTGPGKWEDDMAAGTNMTPEQAKYQQQITGKPASKTYYVNGRSFDGYEPGAGNAPDTLVEAKHLGDEGRFAKAYAEMTKGDPSKPLQDIRYLLDRSDKILDQAMEQAKAARGTGARIEWRVSGPEATKALQQLFSRFPETRDITVRYVKMK
jgi:hypothetical protein